jgi:hypothetical protein
VDDVHKLRRAMVAPERELLKREVEVDEFYVGGFEMGLRGGRKRGKKTLVGIAVEVRGRGSGRVRLQVLEDASASSLGALVQATTVPGATVHTDGWQGYAGLGALGYEHRRRSQRSAPVGEQLLPRAHRAVSNPQGVVARHPPRRFTRTPSRVSRRVRVPPQPPRQPARRLPDAAWAQRASRAGHLPADHRPRRLRPKRNKPGTHQLLYDRTKTVVRAHVGREVSIGERVFHPEALASAHHYGFRLRLCRAYRPQTKGKVESDVPYVRERLLRGHSFQSYEQATAAWRSWNDDVARARVHGTHGEVVAVRAERDRAALLALPATPYLVVERTTRAVARDGFFSFEGRRYAVPGAKPGERVELVLGDQEIEIYSTIDGRRLARHERGRPHRVLPDPVEGSVSLAQVLGALPEPEVHTRPLSVYQAAIDG